MRRFLQRAHIWLGWIVGLQLVLWTVSGLVMAAMPIGTIRGEHLKRDAVEPVGRLRGLLPPETILRYAGPRADSLRLHLLLGRPVYELREGATPLGLFDARSGAPVVIDARVAKRAADARYAGAGRVAEVGRVDPNAVPLDLRREDPAWRVRFDDAEGTVFYMHAVTGELLAARTDRWRVYDFFWGLHIMAPRAREDFNHPLLVAAAALAVLTTTGGVALLLWRAGARRARRYWRAESQAATLRA